MLEGKGRSQVQAICYILFLEADKMLITTEEDVVL